MRKSSLTQWPVRLELPDISNIQLHQKPIKKKRQNKRSAHLPDFCASIVQHGRMGNSMPIIYTVSYSTNAAI